MCREVNRMAGQQLGNWCSVFCTHLGNVLKHSYFKSQRYSTYLDSSNKIKNPAQTNTNAKLILFVFSPKMSFFFFFLSTGSCKMGNHYIWDLDLLKFCSV